MDRDDRGGFGSREEVDPRRILLKADSADSGPGWTDRRIAEAVEMNVATVERVHRRFVEDGFEAALVREKQDRPSRARKLDGAGEARLIALPCSAPPPERTAWTGAAGRQTGGAEGGRHDLPGDGAPGAAKNELKPWLKQQWRIPP